MLPNGKEQVIPIYEDDFKFQRYKNLRFTAESLASKQTLEKLLNAAREEGEAFG
jgi:hypothetical protein